MGAGCKAGPSWGATVGCSSAGSQLCWDTLPWSQLGSALAPSPGSCLLTPSPKNSPSSAFTSSAEAREAACAPPPLPPQLLRSVPLAHLYCSQSGSGRQQSSP